MPIHLCVCLVYLNCYRGAKVAKVAGKAEMSEVAKMPELSKGMSFVSISEMEPCPSRASR
jgi:hypothetical protein